MRDEARVAVLSSADCARLVRACKREQSAAEFREWLPKSQRFALVHFPRGTDAPTQGKTGPAAQGLVRRVPRAVGRGTVPALQGPGAAAGGQSVGCSGVSGGDGLAPRHG